MGKINGGFSSWLSAVKRAFKSPSKDNSGRRRECEQEDEDEKSRGKRRWGLWKSSSQETVIQCDGKNSNVVSPSSASKTKPPTATSSAPMSLVEVKTNQSVSEAACVEQRPTSTVAMAPAQAPFRVVRLMRPPTLSIVKKHYAAIIIQTSFRGYLARSALQALKGLVKLQALVRGFIVRKRAKMTLKCMQALVRAQTRVQEQRRRLSHEGSRDSNSRWESHFADRKQQHARSCSNVEYDWEEPPRTVLEVQSMTEKSKDDALKSEKALAYIFSRQMLKSSRDSFASENEAEERRRLWRCDRTGRASCDHGESLKTVHNDTSKPYGAPSHCLAQNRIPPHSPRTPASARIKHIQVNSASPRLQMEEMNHPKAQTPNLGSLQLHYHGIQAFSAPNYMADTASAKARVRSLSAPKHWSETPEGNQQGTVKKRLLFPVRITRPPIIQHGMQSFTEPRTNISSCCTDSNGEEMSPPSINNLQIWSAEMRN